LVEVLIGVLNEFTFYSACLLFVQLLAAWLARSSDAVAIQDACNGRDAARAQSPSPVEAGRAAKIVVKCPRMVHQFVGLNAPDSSIRTNATLLPMQRSPHGESELSDWSR
jgi:hypothetical protein